MCQGMQEWTKENFLKAIFQKFYLVHSWTLWPIFSYQEIGWNVGILHSAGVGEYGCYNSSRTPLSGTQRTLNCQRHHPCSNESLIPPEENSLPHSCLFFLLFEFYLRNLRKTWTFWMTLPNCRCWIKIEIEHKSMLLSFYWLRSFCMFRSLFPLSMIPKSNLIYTWIHLSFMKHDDEALGMLN